jgi:hypothetical protein
MNGKKLWEMKLHEEINIGPCYILRVPGGWVYTNAVGGSSFVPKDNEFLDDSNGVANNVINHTAPE